jgi:NADPH:quinone reductase-like Zn-dependent oxidoreductase
MKASVFERYGGPNVLQFKDLPKPVPKDDEVLIKIHATSLIAGDCELVAFDFPAWFWLPLRLYTGLFKPSRIKVAGQELAGVIEAVGSQVTRFKVGDPVFASSGPRFSAHADYICLHESGAVALKPPEISFAEAAVIPTGGLNALHFIRKAQIKPGEKVLIVGAAGNLGNYAVQLAKHYGAVVTAVDTRAKFDFLRSLGADHLIDFTTDDFTKSGKKYDIILDIIGKSPFRRSVKTLRPKGRYILANPRINQMLRGVWASKTSDKKVLFQFAPYRTEDMTFLADLVVAGDIKPAIDRTFPFGEITDAHKYVGAKLHKGNVAIDISGAADA